MLKTLSISPPFGPEAYGPDVRYADGFFALMQAGEVHEFSLVHACHKPN
jgi:hypothetical protein